MNIFHIYDICCLYSKTAQPLTPTNKSSLLSKCHVVIPKEVQQSVNESQTRVNKYELK